jgi:hypothetical protein
MSKARFTTSSTSSISSEPSSTKSPRSNGSERSPSARRALLCSLFGVTRVMAYAFVVSLVCAAIGARVVYAKFGEGSLQAGRELAELGDVLGSTKTLGINGTLMNVSTALTERSPSDVVDRFEAICRAHPDFLARALADIPQGLRAAAASTVARPGPELPQMGIFRKDTPDEAVLTCFTDDRPTSRDDLMPRLRAFVKSHDLSELGRFRYVFANRTKQGNTHVTTVWTDGRFNLGAMFPASGDAPGGDSAMVPRPPAAKLVFSAAAAGVPFGVRIYDSARPEAEVRNFYAEQMHFRGWTAVGDRPADHCAAYMKGAGSVFYLSTVSSGDRTFVTATETARSDTRVEVGVEPNTIAVRGGSKW